MWRVAVLPIICALLVQDPPDAAAAKAKLHDDLAAAAEETGQQLLKLKAWDEARAFLEIIRAKSDARADALDKLIAKTDKQTSGLKWESKPSDLIKAYGAERSKPFLAYAKEWKEKDPESSRWTEAEGQILGDLLDYVKAYARLTQIRAHYELPKTRFDWKLSVPAVWHAIYKSHNPADQREISGKAGFTREGEAIAKKSVSSGRETLPELLENIHHAPLYRNYILHPALLTIGLGQADTSKQASTIDVLTGQVHSDTTTLVLYVPRNDSTTTPVTGYDDYTPIFDGKTMRQLGYPISLIIYDPKLQPKEVVTSIRHNMKEVEHYVSTPQTPAGESITPNHKSTILLVPKQPLKGNAEYRVSIRFLDGSALQKHEWTFRTLR